ncbi:MAG: PAS domain S-box protein [Nostocaceae cyanobacterium]|nr:PAS domain S-box protein [Nostocaceae cyanobacterium]
MNPEHLQNLRELARDDAAFERLREILLANQTNDQQAEAPIWFQASLLDRLGSAIIATDVKGNIIYWNPCAENLYQWQAKDVIGKNILDLLVPRAYRKSARQLLLNIANTGIEYREIILRRQDKTKFLAAITNSSIIDVKGNITGFVTLSVDVSERQPSLQKLIERNEDKWRTLIHNSSDIISVIHPEGNVRYVSPSIEKILGYPPEDIIGKNVLDTIHTEDIKKFVQTLNYVSENPTATASIEYRCRRKDGSWCVLESTVRNLVDNPSVAGIVSHSRDITERKQMEEALRQSEERLRLVIQNMPVMMYAFDTYGNIIVWNRECERITGYSATEIVGNPQGLQLLYPDQKSHQDLIQQCQAQGEEQLNCQWEITCKHGTRKTIEWFDISQQFPIPGWAMWAIGIDITHRQQAEREIRSSYLKQQLVSAIGGRIRESLQLDAILNTTVNEVRQFLGCDRVLIYRYQSHGSGMVLVESVNHGQSPLTPTISDPSFGQLSMAQYQQGHICAIDNIATANLDEPQINLLTELSVQAQLVVPISQATTATVTAESPQKEPEAENHHHSSEKPNIWGLLIAHECSAPRQWQQFEIDLLSALSSHVAIAIQKAQLYKQVNELNIDLEHQVQERTQQLQQKVQQLEQLNKLKDEFLSTVSHELRTPLANMKMAIQMLKVSPTLERGQRYLDILQTECNRETDLINDLLDLQRLEASSYPLALNDELYLPTWIPEIIEPFVSRFQQRQQNFHLNLAPNLPTLVSDAAGLARMAAELLNNACKYTASGGDIICQVETTDNFVTFAVSNQAEIPPQALSRIFDKFYRVPGADPWKQGGTGLGLALVKKLVQQLGGTIEVESTNGWTTFTVQLPY